ncbi:MAG TPA: PilZ domain-containing protein [Terriglobales bacterium]|nr:PilZ domain-containing protein [Terriglobales bacterium]
MTFQALLVCKDDDATAVLTPVLSGFGVGVQSCGYTEAMVRLSEQRFDAVVVDFDDPHSAALILQNASQASPRRNTVTVALLADKSKVRSVFGAGANFVLYKPVSYDQAQASLRAATALIKRERRRSFRVPIQLPTQLRVLNGPEMEGILLDLSEDGLDVLSAQPLCPSACISAHFNLPGHDSPIELRGEVAWANPNGQSGVRFVDLSDSLRATLKSWVAANAPELPPEDPEPVSQCLLTDLSLGGCYVKTESPFPEHSGIVLSLRIEDIEVNVEGVVRIMHPEYGMGIEFASRTSFQRDNVASLIEALSSRPGVTPELSITPRSLSAVEGHDPSEDDAAEDSLLELLRHHDGMSQEDFLEALRKQRRSEEVASN